MSSLSHPLLCVAHRGGRSHFSENTLGAFAHSLELGVDAIELDVWQVEGQLLVTHDRRLGKLMPGSGRLLDHGFAGLRALRLPCGSQMPTLDEVLDLVDDRALVNIELKGPDTAATVARCLQARVSDHGASLEQFVCSSFDHRQLWQLRQHLPALRRGVLVEGIPHDYARCCSDLGAWSFHPGLNFLSQGLIDDAKERGLQVWVYTVNYLDDMQLMADMGVDGVFTDEPGLLLELNQHCRRNQNSTGAGSEATPASGS